MSIGSSPSSIRTTGSKRLAEKTRGLLFSALQDFANLQADVAALQRFRRKWPEFFPTEFYEEAELQIPLGGVIYRDGLRRIWKGKSDPDTLANLLGLREYGGESLPQCSSGLNWKTGKFEYQPACPFQQALYELFCSSWRAKTCPQCSQFFIADKPPQIYCQASCSHAAKQERANTWWRDHGLDWRETRQKNTKKGAK